MSAQARRLIPLPTRTQRYCDPTSFDRYCFILLASIFAVDSRDSSQSRDGSVEMADSVATVEMDLDEDEMTSDHAVAENAAAIGRLLLACQPRYEAVSVPLLSSQVPLTNYCPYPSTCQ